MKNTRGWAVLVLLIIAAAAYYFHSKQQTTSPASPPADALQTTPSPPPEPSAPAGPPPIQHPISEAQVAPEATPDNSAKPAPPDSDALAQEALQRLFGADALGNFYLNEIIKRIVTTVDNLPRDKLPRRLMPIKPVPGSFAVKGTGKNLEIGPDNSARYAGYIKLVEAVDSRQLVTAYVHLYPQFQQAYRDLGYPDGYFNDRLIAAIDDLLATPDDAGTIGLTRSGGTYYYADSDIEGLSVGQRIMIRMGRVNAAAVKAKLTDVRSALVGGVPKS